MQPKANITRQTVDLSSFPDLVVIYLGMKVRSPRGLLTVLRFGPRISSAVAEKPPGLLLHESLIFSIFPLHVGMRQYWRDFDSLDRFARDRDLPHLEPWRRFNRAVRDSGDVGIWHETFRVRAGEYEAVYGNMPVFGLAAAATHLPAARKGNTAATRIGASTTDEPAVAPY